MAGRIPAVTVKTDGRKRRWHQREVGAGYFDRIATTVDPNSSTTALTGSTEEGQFH